MTLGAMRRIARSSAWATAVRLRNASAVMPLATLAKPLVGSEAGQPMMKLAEEIVVCWPRRISPAVWINASVASSSTVTTCMCSGPNSFANAAPSSNESTSRQPPFTPSEAAAASRRLSGSAAIWIVSSRCVCSTSVRLVVMSSDVESVPCSASFSRSAARRTGSAVSSARMSDSDGPSTIIVEHP